MENLNSANINPANNRLKNFTYCGLIGAIFYLATSSDFTLIPLLVLMRSLGSFSTVVLDIFRYISIILFIVFFTGYHAKEKNWTPMKALSMCSILCCVVHIIDMALNIDIEPSYNLILSIIITLKWVPFCLALYFYKNIAKGIKRLSLSVIVLEILPILLASSIIEWIMLASSIVLLALLAVMFIKQMKGTFVVESRDNKTDIEVFQD